MDLQKEYQFQELGVLYEMIGKAIQEVINVRGFAKERDLLNTQEYLNFEDTLNKISTMDPKD